MSHITLLSKVTRRANQLTHKYGRATAMRMAWAAEKLIAKMREGTTSFTFIKDNGEARPATGTLDSTVIGAFWTPTGKGAAENPEVVRYFDMEKTSWRSFRVDRLAA